MIELYDNLTKDIWKHVIDCAPDEACGLIVDGSFMPCENVSRDKKKMFAIDRTVMVEAYLSDALEVVIHSHVDMPHLSENDMLQQYSMGIAWGVAFLDDGKKNGLYYWGNGFIQDPIGRPFVHGLYDCYSIVADYYKLNFKIDLPIVPREYGWWDKGENLLAKNLKGAGFYEVNNRRDLKDGDIFLFSMKKNCLCHCMVYTGGETLLHHSIGKISNYVSLYHPIIKRADVVVRHKDL